MSLTTRANIVFIMQMFKDGCTDKDFYIYKKQCKMAIKFTPDQFEKVMRECKDMSPTEFDEKFAAHVDELIGD
jgi:hypothetical protein